MCLIAFNTNQHKKYKLIMIANRDEFYPRPTATAEFWDDHPNILAGRDLESLGTWMGISQSGRISALTNYRDPTLERRRKTSRGDIVADFLTGSESAESYLDELKKNATDYNGYNVVLGTADQLYYYSNQIDDYYELESGTYGLSNHLLNTPWPKVTSVKNKLNTYINNHQEINPNDLFRILIDKTQADDELLPTTGVSQKLEKQLSSIFIQRENYGTRASTVLLIDYDNNVNFIERTFNNGELKRENAFTFKIK